MVDCMHGIKLPFLYENFPEELKKNIKNDLAQVPRSY